MGGRGASSRGIKSKSGTKGALSRWGDNGYGKSAKYVNALIDAGIGVSKPTGGSDNQNAYAQSIKEKTAKELYGGSARVSGNAEVNIERIKENFNSAKKSYEEKITKIKTSPKWQGVAKQTGVSIDEVANRVISGQKIKSTEPLNYKILKSNDSKEIVNLYQRHYNNNPWW